MSYLTGILLSVFVVLAGCGGGGVSSPAAITPPIVSDDPLPAVDDVDYLGQLSGLGTSALNVIGVDGLFASCTDAAKDRGPSAACVTSVSLDGAPALQSDLKAGQIIEVHGQYKTAYSRYTGEELPGVAIDIRRTLVGPVEDVDADRAMLTVLGQRVYMVDSAALSLAIGDVVTVHGHFTADGQVLATLVEPYLGEPLYLVRGVLQEIAPNRFAIGGLEVDLASASRENFPGGAPLAGDSVLVLADEVPARGVLTAQTVHCVGACESARWETGAVRGILTAWRSPTDFDVDGVAIQPSWCECGYGQPPLLGTYVDVSLYGGNAEVYLAPSTTHRVGLAGDIAAVDTANREIVVLGFRVQSTPGTQITATPQWYPDVDALAFGELSIGDAVEVSGEVLGNVVVAGTIVRQGDAQLVRTLDYMLNEPAIEVAGRSVLTDSSTLVNLCEGRGSIGVDEFFATAWADQDAMLLITVDPDSTPLVAREVEVCTPEFR